MYIFFTPNKFLENLELLLFLSLSWKT